MYSGFVQFLYNSKIYTRSFDKSRFMFDILTTYVGYLT